MAIGHSRKNWGSVAFVARCSRRFADRFFANISEPLSARTAVMEVTRLVEARASLGGGLGEGCREAIKINGIWFDNYDIDALHGVLECFLGAAKNKTADLEEDPNIAPNVWCNETAITLAAMSLECGFTEDPEFDFASAVTRAKEVAIGADAAIEIWVEADRRSLRKFESSAGERDPCPQANFGTMWPGDRPPGW